MKSVCPVAVVGKLGLSWTQATSFPGCAGSHCLGGRWGWRCRGSARARYEPGLLLPSVAISALLGVGKSPRFWKSSPEGQVRADSVPVKRAFPHLEAVVLLPQREAVLKPEDPEQVTDVIQGACWVGLGVPVKVPGASSATAFVNSSTGCPCMFRGRTGSEPALSPLTLRSSWQWQPSPWWGAVI